MWPNKSFLLYFFIRSTFCFLILFNVLMMIEKSSGENLRVNVTYMFLFGDISLMFSDVLSYWVHCTAGD